MRFTSNRLAYALRVCMALCFFGLASNASANCTIFRLTSSDHVNQVFKENDGYSFRNYESVCAKLRKANARITINGQYGVLTNRSYGWVFISVADKNNDHLIVNDFSQTMTFTNSYASNDKARELLWLAINDGLNTWDTLDKALARLNQVRQTRKVSKQQ